MAKNIFKSSSAKTKRYKDGSTASFTKIKVNTSKTKSGTTSKWIKTGRSR